MHKLLFTILLVLLITLVSFGCSRTRVLEHYSEIGLLSRDWSSSQIGTSKQAVYSAEQQDYTTDAATAYILNAGENVRMSPEIAMIVQALAQGALGGYGAHSMRRAGALAPVSLNALSLDGFQAQPITQEQLQALSDREETKRRVAELEARIKELQTVHHGE